MGHLDAKSVALHHARHTGDSITRVGPLDAIKDMRHAKCTSSYISRGDALRAMSTDGRLVSPNAAADSLIAPRAPSNSEIDVVVKIMPRK